MTVERNDELVSLQHAGRIVRATIDAMARALEPGMTTLELDRVGEAFAELRGAVSGPRRFYDFPGFSCISINDEAVHGVPGIRIVEAGDLVKIDVALEVDGFVADSCTTVVEGEARRHGAHVIREFGGHGIGRHIHEAPSVQSSFVRGDTYRLPLGLVFTIEPALAETSGGVEAASDGWTVRTRDGALTAQFEHTVVVTRGRPVLLTG